jgi:hypothetical protein
LKGKKTIVAHGKVTLSRQLRRNKSDSAACPALKKYDWERGECGIGINAERAMKLQAPQAAEKI